MTKTKRSTATKSISLTPKTLKDGAAKAKSMGRTFSGHVQWLIEQDLRCQLQGK